MNLSELFGRYLRIKVRDCAPNTVIKYRYYTSKIISYFGNLDIAAVEPAAIDEMYFCLEDKGLTNNTVHQIHLIFRAALEISKKQKLIPENPADFANPPRQKTVRGKSATVAQLEKALKEIKSEKWQIITLLFAYSSRRRGEIAALKYEQINWADQTILFDRNLQCNSLIGIYEKDTKSGVHCIDHFPFSLFNRLEKFCKSNNIESGYIFRSKDGVNPMRPDAYTRFYNRLGKQLGFTLSPHMWRHMVATTLYENNVSDTDICVKLGHSDVTITRRFYIHLNRKVNFALTDVLCRAYANINVSSN